jgi:allantoin racemase
MKIRVIEPVTSEGLDQASVQEFSQVAGPDTELSVVHLGRGPATIESRYEAALAGPDVVRTAMQAEKDGMDAVVSNCMDDPGMEATREMVSIPVVGPAQTSMHVAAMLGHRFSIIGVLDTDAPSFHDHATKAGLEGQLASVRAVNIPVLELEDDRDRLVGALVQQALKAVRDDGAQVIILGCTGMAGLARDVEDGLRGLGVADVPVIDPGMLAFKFAEALADMGLSHSKRSYPQPPQKEIIGYSFTVRSSHPTGPA